MSILKTVESISRFFNEEDGPTSVEYAVLIALIIAVAFGSIQLLGVAVDGSFQDSANMISGAGGS